MRSINLSLPRNGGYEAAEKTAKEAVADQVKGDFSLLAWYDRARDMGAPREACSQENWKCAHDYAEHHHGDIRVSVNSDAYEFYFARTPVGTETLDKESVAAVHTGIAVDQDENVQGG